MLLQAVTRDDCETELTVCYNIFRRWFQPNKVKFSPSFVKSGGNKHGS